MFGRRRKNLVLALLGLLLASVGLWLYSQRLTPVDLSSYVPESAIGYLEVNDWPELADQVTATAAWRELAPAYGLWNKWPYIGEAAALLRTTGLGSGEMVTLARAQLALVVTSLELRGDEVKPRLALLAETHASAGQLRRLIGRRLPQLCARIFTDAAPEASEYAGVPISIYVEKGRAGEGERRIFSAQIESEWILANHPEAIEACIDARLGRAPNLANNFYLQQARPVVGGQLFGFVSGKGATRLAQFGAHLVGREMLSESRLGEALQALLVDMSDQLTHGLGYGLGFDESGAVDRYVWFLQPQLLDQLRAAIKAREGEPRLLEIAPAAARELTIIRIEDTETAFGAIEAAISSRLGAAQSFLFRRFVLGAREALLGLGRGEAPAGAFGDEMASLSLGSGADEQLWLIEAKDEGKLRSLVERYLAPPGAHLRRESGGGVEILVSSDEQRGAAAFFRRYLALGSPRALHRLSAAGAGLTSTASYRAARRIEPGAPILSYESVGVETGRMMEMLARLLPRTAAHAGAAVAALDSLPLATSSWRFDERGLVIDARGPFGNLPFFFNLFAREGERTETVVERNGAGQSH